MIARIRDTYPEVAGNAASVVKIKDDDPLACRYLNSLLKGVKLCETEEKAERKIIILYPISFPNRYYNKCRHCKF